MPVVFVFVSWCLLGTYLLLDFFIVTEGGCYIRRMVPVGFIKNGANTTPHSYIMMHHTYIDVD